MSSDYEEIILESINKLLNYENLPSMTNQNLYYAMEEDVNREDYTISFKNTFFREKLNSIIKPVITKGPSWIHANLLVTTENLNLITLRFGALVGNPNPSINVSYEKNKTVKIINS